MEEEPRSYARTPPSSSGSSVADSDSISDLQSEPRSPSIIIRTGVAPVLRRKRDLPWGIRLIQKVSDSCFPFLSVNRDFW